MYNYFKCVILTIPIAPLSLLAELADSGSINCHARIAGGARVLRLIGWLLQVCHFAELNLQEIFVVCYLVNYCYTWAKIVCLQ